MLKDGTIVTFAESTKKRSSCNRRKKKKKNNDQGGFMRWGFALDEERRKRCPEFFFLVK